jgi:5-amino-6-(5-phosphoribosylamino)uracil reductase
MLLPEPADDVDLARLYADVERPAPPGRPWVLVNMVATADGGTAIDGRSGPLGGAPDRKVFPNVRGVADVILAAAGTVRAESYGPPRPSPSLRAQRRERGQDEVPRLAIVTSSLDLDPGWSLFTEAEVRPLVVTTADAPADRRAALAGVAEVLEAGTGRVDLADALGQIAALGAAVVVCEGGPSLNGQLLAAGLVDELCLTLAPLAIAGTSARIAHGPDAAPGPLRLRHLLEEDGTLFLRYVRT